MGSVISGIEFSEFKPAVQAHTVCFAEDVPGGEGSWLAAVAIWRIGPAPRRWGLKKLLRRLRHRFGPLGAGFHLKGRFEPWSGSWGPNGEQETLYNPERKVVRVLGREYALPEDDQTLVLLIDENGGPGGSPTVRVRALRAPVLPYPSIDTSLCGEQADGALAEQQPGWMAFLQQDPEVQAFMTGGAEDV